MSDAPDQDISMLGALSRRLALALFSAMPEVRKHADMNPGCEADGLSLSVLIPSPTQDEERSVWVWVDEAPSPSLGFGPMHTHFAADDVGIAETIDLCRAVLSDQCVIIQDIGGAHDGHTTWVDLRDPHALADELTSPYGPGRARLKSWSGTMDREVGVEDS
jgi:hypothetical protein